MGEMGEILTLFRRKYRGRNAVKAAPEMIQISGQGGKGIIHYGRVAEPVRPEPGIRLPEIRGDQLGGGGGSGGP